MEKSAKILLALLGILGFSIMLSMVVFPPDSKDPKEVTVQPSGGNEVIAQPVPETEKEPPVAVDNGSAAIYPVRALDADGNDLETCFSNTGKEYYTTGYNESNYASWFNWGDCARSRIYNVNSGQKIRFKITTDSCDSCVCTQPEFCIYQDSGGQWEEYDCLDFSADPGSERNYYFTPRSAKIMVTSDTCFYLHLYYSAD